MATGGHHHHAHHHGVEGGPQQQQQHQQQPQQHPMEAWLLSNYKLGKTLGVGSFGKVKIAEHILTKHKVAVKILNWKKIKQQDMDEKVQREIKILRLFMHPHIIRLYEVIETPHDIYVVMEYVKAGELFDYIVEKGRLLEDEARRFFQQIISGVEYCHRNMVVHRDLKPENLLLDSRMNLKIADFGLSNVMRDGHFLKTSCGSPNYAAPEVISGKLYAGPEVDVWSCGVILYALLCGSLPFDDENIPNLFKKIKGGIYNLPSHLSPGARDLIPRMLLVDPLKRITIPEIRQHPWFTLHLPCYLAVAQTDGHASLSLVDEEVLTETARLGFDRQRLLDDIRARKRTKGTVAYYLTADNRRMLDSSTYLKEELKEEAASAGRGFPSGLVGAQGGASPHQRLVAERRWRLGVHSRGHPSATIVTLLRALEAHGATWKKNGPYNYKCRAVKPALARSASANAPPPGDPRGVIGGAAPGAAGKENAAPAGRESPGSMEPQPSDEDMVPDMELDPKSPRRTQEEKPPGDAAAAAPQGAEQAGAGPGEEEPRPQRELKFELQMYKTRDGEYCIDIQRLSGELFHFMDLCGTLLCSLKV